MCSVRPYIKMKKFFFFGKEVSSPSLRRWASYKEMKKFFFRKSSNEDKSSKKVHSKKSVLDLCCARARTPDIQPPENFSQASDAENSYFQKAYDDQVAERAATKEEVRLLKVELDSQRRRLEAENNELKSTLGNELERRSTGSSVNEKSCPVRSHFDQQNAQKPDELKQLELKAETLLMTVLQEKLCSKERDIEQLHAELAAAVRGNDILKCETQNALDTLSCANHKMKDFELQMMKKEEHMNQLQNELQECMKERDQLWEDVKQYSKLLYSAEERDKLWESVKQYSELLYSENNSLKQKVKVLEEDVLLKEGQITILKDSIGKRSLKHKVEVLEEDVHVKEGQITILKDSIGKRKRKRKPKPSWKL